MNPEITRKLDEASRFLRQKRSHYPPVAVILGSGLGQFARLLKDPVVISTKEIPHYPQSTVTGHAGEWVIGRIGKKEQIVIRGRVHFYEGYAMAQVVFPILLLGNLGVRSLIVTNAAGSLNPQFRPGDLMLIDDQINLFFRNPLAELGLEEAKERFVDMSAPFDPDLMRLAEQAALETQVMLRRGTLIGSPGPTYETAAEVSMMRRMGGDAATMSTIPEVIAARHLGMRVLGISCITNYATGLSPKKLDHKEVTEVAAAVAHKFQKLLRAILLKLPENGT